MLVQRDLRGKLSAIILAKNEELNIEKCLRSLEPLGINVAVVDSGSTDRTVAISESLGATVLFHEWHSHAEQFNWSLDNLPERIRSEWILRIDADEALSNDSIDKLVEFFAYRADTVDGAFVRRRVVFMGKWIRFGGFYPKWTVRLFRLGVGRCEGTWMDEHIVVAGSTTKLAIDLVDDDQKGLYRWITKHIGYAEKEARDVCIGRGKNTLKGDPLGARDARTRWFKVHLYESLPLFVRPFLYFAFRYVIQLGFLDGPRGFVFHVLQGLWYRLMVDAYVLAATLSAGATIEHDNN